MARSIIARAKHGLLAVLAVAVSMAFSQGVAFAQSGDEGPAYTFNRTPTEIPGITSPKKPWYSKVGGSISKGWNATTGVFKKAMPQRKKTPKLDKRDPVHLGGNKPNASAELHAGMAQIFMEQGRNDLAIKHFNDAFKIDPDNLKAVRGYARFLQRQGKVAEAEQQFRRALKIDGNSPGTWNDLGMSLAQQGKRAEAVQAIERAIELRPRKALYRNNAAAVLIEMGKNQRAFDHLAVAHGEAKAHYNVGYLLVKTNQRQAAAAHFNRALQLDSSMVAARQWLDQIHGRRPAEMVAQRPVNVRPPVATPPIRRDPVASPPATRPMQRTPSTQAQPSEADRFWGRPATVPAGKSPFETSPSPTVVTTPPQTTQHRPPTTAIRPQPHIQRPATAQTAENQFWSRPAQTPATRQTQAPPAAAFGAPPTNSRPQPPITNRASIPPRTASPVAAPPATAPPQPAASRGLPSQQ
ncbi:MAG: tetratricopeptide repeat protein, partial [Pirellulales bacterium]|nr:tetratricopeptide repeat protein [Pirellulales bacterium]